MRRKVVVLLLGVLFWSGCSSPIEVLMSGTSDMNNGGNAAVVRIYELSGENNFTNTPVSAFWRDDEGALGDELVTSPRTQTLYPNESATIEIELADKTTFIGIAADLRDPEQEQWRAIYSVDEVGDQISITVHSNRISVQAEGGVDLPLVSRMDG